MQACRRRSWGVWLGLFLPGCSLVVNAASDPQCTTDKDCIDRGFQATCVDEVCVAPTSGTGGAAPTPWGCLGNVTDPPAQGGAMVDASFRILLVSAEMPPPGMTARVCQAVDVNCASPLAEDLTADPAGNLKVQLPSGFEGFLEIQSPSTVPSIVFIGRPIVTVPKTNTVRLIKTDEFGALAGLAGQIPDDTRGHALILVTNCLDEPAPGVEVNSMDGDAATKKFYLIGTLPKLDGDVDRTDASGFAGYFNMPPGIVSVESRRADDKSFVGKYGIRVKPGVISYLLLGPTPGG